MPYKLKAKVRNKFKKKAYNKRDWRNYEQGLKDRGSLTIWFSEEAVKAWNHSETGMKRKKGRQKRYSDLAIETSHLLRLVYKQPLRQTEGLMKSIVRLLQLDLEIPDHTTISRRSQTVKLRKSRHIASGKPLTLIIDSTGLKVVGEKEWMSHKHGVKQRKVWRKLHLCIDENGDIINSSLTHHNESDAGEVDGLLNGIDSPIKEMLGDGGYDHNPTYEALAKHQKRHKQSEDIQVIIPPNTGFKESTEGDSQQRRNNILFIEDKGKLAWQRRTDYGRRSKVENTIYRYKTIIGNKLRSKNIKSQITESQIAAQILNTMNSLSRRGDLATA